MKFLEHITENIEENFFYWIVGHGADINNFYSEISEFIYKLDSKNIPYIVLDNDKLYNPFDGLDRLLKIWDDSVHILGEMHIMDLNNEKLLKDFVMKFVVAMKIEDTDFTLLDLENAIITSLKMFIKIFYKEFYVEKSKMVFVSKLKAFLFKCIYWYNNIIHSHISINKNGFKIIFYDNIITEQVLFLDMLYELGISTIIIDTDGEKQIRDIHINEIGVIFFEFDYKSPKRSLETLKKKTDRISTVAVTASNEIQHEIYNEETGVFKPKQLANHKLSPILLKTIFDETPDVLYEETRYRAGFRIAKNMIYSPQLFLKIDGLPSNSIDENLRVLTEFYAREHQSWVMSKIPVEYFAVIAKCIENRETSFSNILSNYDLNLGKRINHAIKMVNDIDSGYWNKNSFANERIAKKIIESTLKFILLSNNFSFLLKKIDLPFMSPKIVWNDSELSSNKIVDDYKIICTTIMLFAYLTGFDIILFSYEFNALFESYLNPSLYNKISLSEVYSYENSVEMNRKLFERLNNPLPEEKDGSIWDKISGMFFKNP